MGNGLLAGAVVIAVVVFVLVCQELRRLKICKLRATPPPKSWQPILEQYFTMVQHLTGEQRKQFFGTMQVFLDRVNFEKPKQLQEKHPELYEELRSYYNVNPIDWQG